MKGKIINVKKLCPNCELRTILMQTARKPKTCRKLPLRSQYLQGFPKQGVEMIARS